MLDSLEARAHAAAASGSISKKVEAARCALALDCLRPSAHWVRAAIARAKAAQEAEDDEEEG
jgi:DNA-binding NarL/FixJ family response regulator